MCHVASVGILEISLNVHEVVELVGRIQNIRCFYKCHVSLRQQAFGIVAYEWIVIAESDRRRVVYSLIFAIGHKTDCGGHSIRTVLLD